MTAQLISDEHMRRLRTLYERDERGEKKFGRIGYLWAPRVAAYMQELKARSLLDYGCGKSNLALKVSDLLPRPPAYTFTVYDPVTAPSVPEPADFVTSIDVLEHVELECLDAVLHDIRRCMQKAALITVSLRDRSPKKAKVHPIVRPRDWWIAKISLEVGRVQEVPILNEEKAESEVALLVRPYETFDL